jgi:hypothetical protein
MRTFLKIVTAACVLSGIIICGFVLGWFKPKSNSTSGDQAAVDPSTQTEEAPGTTGSPRTNLSASTLQHPPGVSRLNPPTAIATGSTNAEWEDKLEAILRSEGDDSEKTKQLYAMFPQLPEDGQVEIAQHLSNLVSDQDYAPLGKMLADPKEPEGVLDVLIADLLNRPNATKLPMLLDVAKNSQHPKAVEAKDLLELYLEEDYGQDWAKWQAKTDQWLKDNPD